MVDRIVISLLIGLVGGFVIWGAAVLAVVLDDYVPWYFMVSAAVIFAIAAFIIDIRTRTEE